VSRGGLVGEDEEEDEELPPALPLLALMAVEGGGSGAWRCGSSDVAQMTVRSPANRNRNHGLV
jgi:hypothetical protein